jgi:tRNA-guanine family transglycosylase
MLSVFDFIDTRGKFSKWGMNCIENKKPLEAIIGIPKEKVLWMDSGGYELAHLDSRTWYKPTAVSQFQSSSGCDISCVLDIPFTKLADREETKKLIEMNFEFVRTIANIATSKTCLMTVAHGSDESSIVEYAKRLLAEGRPHVVAVPWRDLKSKGYLNAFSTLRAVSEVTRDHCRLHVLAAGSVDEWPFIYACGADTIDSTTWAHRLLDPKSLAWKDPTRSVGLNCSCLICKNRKTPIPEKDPSKSLNLYLHNLTLMNELIQKISGAMAHDTISELAKEVNPGIYKEHGNAVFGEEGQ